MFERRERVGDVLECGEHRAAILLGGLLIGSAGGALLVQRVPPSKIGASSPAPMFQKPGPGAEHLADGKRVAAGIRGEADVWQPVRGATPIWALAAWRLASAWSTSGRCSTKAEGKLSGRFEGNVKLARVNFSRPLTGIAAGEHRDQVLLLVTLLDQRRASRFELRKLRLLRGDVGAPDIALRFLVLQQAEDLAVDCRSARWSCRSGLRARPR